MKNTIRFLLAATLIGLSGCALSPTGFINSHVPDGTMASIHISAGVTGGSGGTLDATNVVKANSQITLGPGGTFDLQMHNLLEPVFELKLAAPAASPVVISLSK